MIRNDRQLATTERKIRQLLESAEHLEGVDRHVYLDLAEELQKEIDEYRRVRSGLVRRFVVQSFDQIADCLVKARIALRLTQRQLGERLGVTEQMVQKDESGGYERASLARVADVADALGYELQGYFLPRDEAESQRTVLVWEGSVHVPRSAPGHGWSAIYWGPGTSQTEMHEVPASLEERVVLSAGVST